MNTTPSGIRPLVTVRRLSTAAPMLAALVATPNLAACGAPPAVDDVGVVQLALETVPSDVTCIRIAAAGPYRETSQTLSTTPGMPLEEPLTGVPLGLVTFEAEAFDRDCSSVSARTVPTWVAAPVEVSVVAGSKTRVELTMQRNGRVDATFTFDDEPLCSGAGVACRSDRECCSGACTSGACEASDTADAGSN